RKRSRRVLVLGPASRRRRDGRERRLARRHAPVAAVLRGARREAGREHHGAQKGGVADDRDRPEPNRPARRFGRERGVRVVTARHDGSAHALPAERDLLAAGCRAMLFCALFAIALVPLYAGSFGLFAEVTGKAFLFRALVEIAAVAWCALAML